MQKSISSWKAFRLFASGLLVFARVLTVLAPQGARATVYRPGLWFFVPAGTWNDFTTTNAAGSMKSGPHMAWSNSRQTLRPGEVPKWAGANKYGYAGAIYVPRACTIRFAGCFVDNWNLRFNGALVLSNTGGYLKQTAIAMSSAGWCEFGLRCYGSSNCGAGWKSDGTSGYTLDTVYPGFGYRLDGEPSTLPADYTYAEDAGDAEFLRYVDATNFTSVAAPTYDGGALLTTLTVKALPTNATVTAFIGGNNVGEISNLWEHVIPVGPVARGDSTVPVNLAGVGDFFPAFVRFRVMTAFDLPFEEKFVEWTEPVHLRGPYLEKPDFTFTDRQTDDAPGATFTTTVETIGEGATWCDLLGVFTPAGETTSTTGLLGRVTTAGTYIHAFYPLKPLVDYAVTLVATNDAGGVSFKLGLPIYCINPSLISTTCTSSFSTYTNLTVKGTVTNLGYGKTTLLLYLTRPGEAETCVTGVVTTALATFSMPVQALPGWGETYQFRVVCSNECDGVFWTMTTATAEATVSDNTVYVRRADVPDGDWRDPALWTGGTGVNCGYPTAGSGLDLGSVAEFSAVTTRVHHAEYINPIYILCKNNSETVFLGDAPATCSISVKMYGNNATNCTIIFDGVNFVYRDNRDGYATDATIAALNGGAFRSVGFNSINKPGERYLAKDGGYVSSSPKFYAANDTRRALILDNGSFLAGSFTSQGDGSRLNVSITGTNGLFKCTGNASITAGVFDFKIPEGGYSQTPMQMSSDFPGTATGDLVFNIAKGSKTRSFPQRLRMKLLDVGGTLATNQIVFGRLPNPATDRFYYTFDKIDAETGSKPTALWVEIHPQHQTLLMIR
jgi:hypothetical protein